jgi:hypothetical protein
MNGQLLLRQYASLAPRPSPLAPRPSPLAPRRLRGAAADGAPHVGLAARPLVALANSECPYPPPQAVQAAIIACGDVVQHSSSSGSELTA